MNIIIGGVTGIATGLLLICVFHQLMARLEFGDWGTFGWGLQAFEGGMLALATVGWVYISVAT